MLRYANVTATIALFVALGGSSYAAITLERDSVKSGHIAKGQVKRADIARRAVGSEHVRDGSLLAGDFRPGELPAGPPGPAGTQGPAGVQGPAGGDGAAGQDGAAGSQGPVGPQGPAGPSGAVDILGFDGSWGDTALPGNNGNTIVTPTGCRTKSHVAGPGEVAVIQLAGTGAPSQATSDLLYIFAMVSVNGAAFAQKNVNDSANALTGGTAAPSIVVRYPLETGKSYVFAAGFASNAALTIAPGFCHGVVTILRTA